MIDKQLILSRIKSHYNLKSDVELARFLDIPTTTLSSWKSRNSIDYDLIFEKCGKEVFYYVVTGDEDLKTSMIHDLEKKDAFIDYIRDENDKLRQELKELKKLKSSQ